MNDAFLIVGLGNPGAKYAKSRHNIGFMCIEALAQKLGLQGKLENRMDAVIYKGNWQEKKFFLIEPATYMNRSGQAVVKIINYYKIPLENVLVALDDVDLPFGKIRFRGQGSAGSHNGMKSVIDHLGTKDISRLKVGINSAPPGWDLADYVLSNFSLEEEKHLPSIVSHCTDAVIMWIEEGMVKVMNRYNSLDIIEQPVDSSVEGQTS